MDEKNMMNEMPTLTLDPFGGTAQAQAQPEPEVEKKPVDPVALDDTLNDAEKKMVSDFAQQIDIRNSAMVLSYGAQAQQKLAGFSESALGNVRTKDLGEVGDMITDLIGELKGFDADEDDKGIFGFFKKQTNKLETLKMKYDKAEVNVEKIASML